MASASLQWNAPAITSEMFDDEVVIVNFDSGKYHSLQGAGPLIWKWLESPATLDEILDNVTSGFSGDHTGIEHDVRTFVAALETEGLIVPVLANATPLRRSCTDEPAAPFTPPVLNTFSDMRELLLLDPIHDVDEAGWPVTRDHGGN